MVAHLAGLVDWVLFGSRLLAHWGGLATLAAKGVATEGIRAGLTGDDFDPMKALTSAATTFGVDKAVQAGAERWCKMFKDWSRQRLMPLKLADLSKAEATDSSGATLML